MSYSFRGAAFASENAVEKNLFKYKKEEELKKWGEEFREELEKIKREGKNEQIFSGGSSRRFGSRITFRPTHLSEVSFEQFVPQGFGSNGSNNSDKKLSKEDNT
jgi:hypothetical protein